MAYSYNPLNNYETEIVTHQSNAGNVNEQRVFKIKITPKNNAVLLVNDFKVDAVCSSGVNFNGDNLYPLLTPSNTPHLLTNTYQHFYNYDTSAPPQPQYSPVSMQFCIFTETGDTNISGQTSFALKYPNIDQIIFYEVYQDDNGNEVNVIDETTIPNLADFNQIFVNGHFWDHSIGPAITNLTTPIRIEAIVYLNQNIVFPLTQDINVDFDFDQMLGSPILYGCTDPLSDTYNANATIDDGSCEYYGCTDSTAGDFPDINGNDSSGTACSGTSVTLLNGTVVSLCDSGDGYANTNFDPDATHNPNGDCIIAFLGCTDDGYQEYDALATVDDGSCLTLNGIDGCDDSTLGYNPIKLDDEEGGYVWRCIDGSIPFGGDPSVVISADPSLLSTYDQEVRAQGGYCVAANGYDALTYNQDASGNIVSGLITHNASLCFYCNTSFCGDPNFTEYNASVDTDYADDICIDNTLCLTPVVNGCMDDPSISTIIKFDGTSGPYNYDPLANVDNGPYSLYYTNPSGGGSNCVYFPGCTDPNYVEYYTQTDTAGNYYVADIDNGTCNTYKVDGCTDPNDANYPTGCGGDFLLGTCWITVGGLNDDGTNPQCCPNYDDGSCAGIIGCTDDTVGTNPDIFGNCRTAQSYDPLQPDSPFNGSYLNVNTGVYIFPNLSLLFVAYGQGSCDACEDTLSNPNSGYLNINYNPNATYDDTPTLCLNCGCMDPDADNYDSLATVDDGGCIWSPGGLINIRPMLDGGTINTASGNPYDFYERDEDFATNLSGVGLGGVNNTPYLTKTIFPHHYVSGLNSNFSTHLGGLSSIKPFTHQNGFEFQQYSGTIELFTSIASGALGVNMFDYETRANDIVVNPNSLGFSAVGCTYDAITNRWSGGTMPDGVEIEFAGFYNATFPALYGFPATDLAVEYLAEAFTEPGLVGTGLRSHVSFGGIVNFLKTIVHFTNWPQNAYPPNRIDDGLSSYLLNLSVGQLTNPDVTDPAGVSVHMNSIPQFAYTYVEGCTDSTPGITNDFPDVNGKGVDGNNWASGAGNGFESSNYNPAANVSDGSCNACNIFGCTDPTADNYNPNADCDDGSCSYFGGPIADHDECGVPTMGSFINVNNNPALPESTAEINFCIQKSYRPFGHKNYFHWEMGGGFVPEGAGSDDIYKVVHKCYSGQYNSYYPLWSTLNSASGGAINFTNGMFTHPTSGHWRGFGCITTMTAEIESVHSPITSGSVDWFGRPTVSITTKGDNPHLSNLNLPKNGGTSHGPANSHTTNSGMSNVVVILPNTGDHRLIYAHNGSAHPDSFQWEENPNSSLAQITGKRAYALFVPELVGPLWRRGFQRTSLSSGIVNFNGQTEKTFSSIYRSVKNLTMGDNYILKIQVAVDAPSNANSNYNYHGLGFEMDAGAQTNLGNNYDYNGQFEFVLGFADPDSTSSGTQTTINWISAINLVSPTPTGRMVTSCHDETVTFNTTGVYNNYCSVRGVTDHIQTQGGSGVERPLTHLFEIFNFEFPFTATDTEHAVAITMTEGTIMYILNIHVAE